jgi:hypothetical protein
MFYKALSFNQNINSWNISDKTDIFLMFNNTKSFNKNNALWYDFEKNALY